MKLPVRLAAFAVALGVVFAATYGAGALAGPVAAPDSAGHQPADRKAASHDQLLPHVAEAPVSEPGGLAVASNGYTLRQIKSDLTTGMTGDFAFQILDDAGFPVTGFQTTHDKKLHLVVARRDLTGFQHLHPVMSPDGTWRTPLTLPAAGDWRVFADFLPVGRDAQVVLGLDVPVAGDYRPQPLPPASTIAAVDGYTVTTAGALEAGHTSRLTLAVSKAGVPVTDLEPYLGAYGHLVALRAGDLAYLHVHPQHTDAAGPEITFDVEVPTTDSYRLFLDFQHGGVVRTAAFTATAGS